ncbi:MAG: LysR family transcriptional regulator [Deltaproteobacteria bacterium]|nr:LysR family transcriptional regulator [Deltaproteobacteria bacterium]
MLYQHWSWLPHFRAIAETQHLGAAAKLLHVTPPAMSRALQRLEEALGTQLFERRGRNLALNDVGAELLVSVRAAMRHLDDAFERVGSQQAPASVKVSAPGPYNAAVVLPMLARARGTWPELRFELVDAPASIPTALLRGDVDVCLHEHVVAGAQIQVEAISEVQKVIACARSHPAARKKQLGLRDLCAYAFVGPPEDANGVRHDGWPLDVERRVELTVANMQLGVDAAASGRFLAVLPLPIVIGTDLISLRARAVSIPPTTIYVSRRRPLSTTSDVVARVIGLLGSELQRLRNR